MTKISLVIRILVFLKRKLSSSLLKFIIMYFHPTLIAVDFCFFPRCMSCPGCLFEIVYWVTKIFVTMFSSVLTLLNHLTKALLDWGGVFRHVHYDFLPYPGKFCVPYFLYFLPVPKQENKVCVFKTLISSLVPLGIFTF